MIYIAVPDMNDSVSTITLEGKKYKIRFTYNEKFDYWNFGLLTEDDKNIVAMTKIVPNYPLLYSYTSNDVPKGVFGCLCDKGKIGKNAFKDKTAQFVYITSSEVENG